jgi:hypothetical protein
MLNEGLIVNDSAALVRSEIVKQIGLLGPTTPDQLEQAVFRALTGHGRDEVDWDVEDNQAGYHMWLKSFDTLIGELVEDGYILVEKSDDGGQQLTPTERLPHIEYSHLVYPPSRSE